MRFTTRRFLVSSFWCKTTLDGCVDYSLFCLRSSDGPRACMTTFSVLESPLRIFPQSRCRFGQYTCPTMSLRKIDDSKLYSKPYLDHNQSIFASFYLILSPLPEINFLCHPSITQRYARTAFLSIHFTWTLENGHTVLCRCFLAYFSSLKCL